MRPRKHLVCYEGAFWATMSRIQRLYSRLSSVVRGLLSYMLRIGTRVGRLRCRGIDGLASCGSMHMMIMRAGVFVTLAGCDSERYW